MKGTILLNYSEDTKKVEEEEKSRFLRTILDQCFENNDVSTEIQSIWEDDIILSAIQKIKLRNILNTYNINVIDNNDGELKVFLDSELIGNWTKCSYKLKSDPQAIDPRKRIFIEMSVNYWNIFEKESS